LEQLIGILNNIRDDETLKHLLSVNLKLLYTEGNDVFTQLLGIDGINDRQKYIGIMLICKHNIFIFERLVKLIGILNAMTHDKLLYPLLSVNLKLLYTEGNDVFSYLLQSTGINDIIIYIGITIICKHNIFRPDIFIVLLTPFIRVLSEFNPDNLIILNKILDLDLNVWINPVSMEKLIETATSAVQHATNISEFAAHYNEVSAAQGDIHNRVSRSNTVAIEFARIIESANQIELRAAKENMDGIHALLNSTYIDSLPKLLVVFIVIFKIKISNPDKIVQLVDAFLTSYTSSMDYDSIETSLIGGNIKNKKPINKNKKTNKKINKHKKTHKKLIKIHKKVIHLKNTKKYNKVNM
jgi:hypothetical protein